MYIENFQEKNKPPERNHWKKQAGREKKATDSYLESPKELKKIEAPEEELLPEHSRDVLIHWRTEEFEKPQRGHRWHLFATFLLILVISFAVYMDAMVMAITFLLIGIVGYIYLDKKPRMLDFMITYDGVLAGKELYRFKNTESFWIFYEDGLKSISLHTDGYLSPYIHIPLFDQDPVKIREILIKYIPEKEQELTLFDRLEKLIKI